MMCATPRFPTPAWSLFLAACAAAGIVFHADAAYTVPPELHHAAEEQIHRYQETVAYSAKQEQTAAAERAYRERLAFRRTLAKAIQAGVEQRRQEINAQLVKTGPRSVPAQSNSRPVMVLIIGILAAGWFLLRLCRRRSLNQSSVE